MSDFSKAKLSANFEDRTGDTEHDKGMRAVANSLNPVYAYRKVRSALIENGIVSPPPRLNLGLRKSGGK